MGSEDRRVEAKTLLIGMGLGTTPERIEELKRRIKESEKLTPKTPSQPFSSVLSKQTAAKPQSRKEQQTQRLPKKGPRPKMVHPSQRELLERDHDPIVLKG